MGRNNGFAGPSQRAAATDTNQWRAEECLAPSQRAPRTPSPCPMMPRGGEDDTFKDGLRTWEGTRAEEPSEARTGRRPPTPPARRHSEVDPTQDQRSTGMATASTSGQSAFGLGRKKKSPGLMDQISTLFGGDKKKRSKVGWDLPAFLKGQLKEFRRSSGLIATQHRAVAWWSLVTSLWLKVWLVRPLKNTRTVYLPD